MLLVILFAMAGSLYLERGGLITASITSYALSSIVAGYVSGGFYNQFFYPQVGFENVIAFLCEAHPTLHAHTHSPRQVGFGP